MIVHFCIKNTIKIAVVFFWQKQTDENTQIIDNQSWTVQPLKIFKGKRMIVIYVIIKIIIQY